MCDHESSEGGVRADASPTRQPEATREMAPGLEALRAQQTTLLNTMMQQVNSLNARVEVAEAEAAASAAKAATQGSGTAQSRDAEIEALRQFPYVTLVAGNPSPTRPATLENHMPQTHHLYNDNTYNALCKRTNALMRYERLVLAPALSYLHDSAAHSASAVDSVTDKENAPTMEDLGEGVSAAHNTVKGVLALLNNRYTMIQLRARMESDATVHGGAESVACEAGVHRGEDLTFRAERCWTPCASRGVQRREPTLQEKGVSGAEPGDEQVASCDGLPLVELAPRQVALQDRDSKKLRRLAKPDNWCFSFDLQDGYHVVGINPAFQEYMQFDVWGSCFSAAPFLSGRKSCLIRNEKKGHWEAAQLVEHLGLEVDLKAGQFHVTPARLQNIHVKAKALLSKASGQRRWLPAQRIATFAGLCQSVYLAVPLARLSRRELHYVLFTKRGWSSHGRRGVVAQAASSVPVEQSQDLTKPDESEAAHRLVPLRLGRHFTSRNPELMRRMRLLWILLDLRHRAPSKVHQKRVDRFASELSAQLPRYCAQWHDPGCEGVDSLAFSGLGEVNWVNPPWSLLDEVAHKLREERCSATVVAPYWLGQIWFQQLEAMADESFCPGAGTSLLPAEAGRVRDGTVSCSASPPPVGDTGEDGLTWVVCDDGNEEVLEMSKEKYEVLPAAVQHLSSWDAALQERWRGELGDSSLTELAVQMQAAALGEKMCRRPTKPYLSAINNHHEDMGYPGPAKGRGVSRAVKAMSSLQVRAADDAGDERTWLPARHVSAMHAHMLQLQPVGMTETELLRACTYVVFTFVTFGRPDTGVPMQRTHISITGDTVSVVLHKEKGRRHVRLKRRLTIPAAGVLGLVKLLQHWQQVRDASWVQHPVASAKDRSSYRRLPWERGKLQLAQANGWLSSAIHSYINPTAVPDEHMEKYFGWTTPRW
ncbi:hypothetical protein CYMTET_48293 [Cymbomonas tetramitiformis]|uniref:Uncharacterized protein n=1 Tax=Cymbomonas tetramitiformis TaxID=36881 RepID=A0AAE0BUD4_9CHLO|nr:hypothetical protein CYMTET_48293 [Cymbomonas tetramitiformis]